MIFKLIKNNAIVEDTLFNNMYPSTISRIAAVHFTPIHIAKIASEYLAYKPNIRVLDIGSGVGKFCMIGSVCTEGYFVGVEQRLSLCDIANQITLKHGLTRVNFIHENITNISFQDFDAFYFFNPFEENIAMSESINNEIELKHNLYSEYTKYVKEQLSMMPIGTRLVTFHSYSKEVPFGYSLQTSMFCGDLKMWEKKS